MLASALLVACGSRSGLLGGGEEPIFGPSHQGGAAGATATGGTPVSAGTATTGGAGPTGGVSFAGKTSGGKGPTMGGGFPIGGEPPLQGGEGPSFAGAGNDFDEPTEVLWGKRFGTAQPDESAVAIAVEPYGVFTITGAVRGDVDFGGGKLISGGETDAYLAQFDPDGAPRWSAVYGDAGVQEGRGVAMAPDGTIGLVGAFAGTVDFGGGSLQSQGGYDAYLAIFDYEGKFAHARSFGSSDNQTADGVTFAAQAAPVWAGSFRGSIAPGATTFTSKGSVDVVVAAYYENGDGQWSLQAGDSLAQRANAIAHSETDGSVFVVGNVLGTLQFGACSQLLPQAVEHGYIAWIDLSGNCNRSINLLGDGTSQALAVATGKSPLSQLVAMGGRFTKEIRFAGVTAVNTTAETDAFVAVLEGDRNNYSFRQDRLIAIGGPGSQEVNGLTFDSQDNLIVVGKYDGDGTAANLPSSPSSFSHAFVIKYDPAGHPLWSKVLGDDTGNTIARAVGVDSDDNIYVAGSFEGTMPLTTGTLQSAGKDDIFVVKLAP